MAPFVYQTLEPNHIRLLYLLPSTSPDLDKIECEIVRVHIDQAKDYEALSYVWGPPDAIESTIQIQSPNRQLWKSASSSSKEYGIKTVHSEREKGRAANIK